MDGVFPSELRDDLSRRFRTDHFLVITDDDGVSPVDSDSVIYLNRNAPEASFTSALNVLSAAHRLCFEKESDAESRLKIQLHAIIDHLPFDFWACNDSGVCLLQNHTSISYRGNIVGKKCFYRQRGMRADLFPGEYTQNCFRRNCSFYA